MSEFLRRRAAVGFAALTSPCVRLGLLLGLALLLGACGPSDDPGRDPDAAEGPGETLRVSAAASLRDALGELAARFEDRHPGLEVELNFAGSNVLAQQIRATPQADVFLSADQRWVDDLLAGKLVAGSDRAVVANRLVAVARPDAGLADEGLDDLAGLTEHLLADEPARRGEPARRLVLADPAAVPAGRYARAYFEAEGLWDDIAPRVVPALDVRAALALVETDPSFVGLVYRTDAAASDRVEVLLELPPRPGIDVVIWGGLVAKDEPTPRAAEFLDFLGTPEALGVAADHGFLPPAP